MSSTVKPALLNINTEIRCQKRANSEFIMCFLLFCQRWWATDESYYCLTTPCPIMAPCHSLTAVLPCTHLRMCRFLSAGSARNPPADSAGTGRHWSSSFPLPITAPIAGGRRTPTMYENRYFKKNIRRQKTPARIQCSSNMASTAHWACAMDIMAYPLHGG